MRKLNKKFDEMLHLNLNSEEFIKKFLYKICDIMPLSYFGSGNHYN